MADRPYPRPLGIDLVVLFLIVFDMVVKPSFSDGWTIIAALVVAAAIAGLLVLPALRSTVPERPA